MSAPSPSIKSEERGTGANSKTKGNQSILNDINRAFVIALDNLPKPRCMGLMIKPSVIPPKDDSSLLNIMNDATILSFKGMWAMLAHLLWQSVCTHNCCSDFKII